MHDDEGALVEFELALAVVLHDLELAHAVAHRPAAEVVGGELVGEGAGGARDGEAFGAVAGGDVVVELAAGGELAGGVEGLLALAVDDVEVDVVGVGLPVEDEAERGGGGDGDAVLVELGLDGLLAGGVAGDADGGEDRRVLAEDAVDAAEAAAGVGLGEADEDRGEGLLVAAGAGEGVGEEAVAGGVVGALQGGLFEGVDGEGEAGGREALEAGAGVAAEVGAVGEQVDDRTVGASGLAGATGGLVDLAEREQGEHVAAVLVVPGEGAGEGLVVVAGLDQREDAGHVADDGVAFLLAGGLLAAHGGVRLAGLAGRLAGRLAGLASILAGGDPVVLLEAVGDRPPGGVAALEHEGVGDLGGGVAGEAGEGPGLDARGDAAGGLGVRKGGLLDDGVADLAVAGDVELDGDAALDVRVLLEAAEVAVADLVDVGADDAADDVLVERAADLGLGLADRRRVAAAAAEAGTGAATVAAAAAAAGALGGGAAHAALLAATDDAVGAEADLTGAVEVGDTAAAGRAADDAEGVAGAAAAATGADEAEAADAVGLADLGAGEAAPDVGVVVADREGAAVGAGEEVAALLGHDAEDAGLARGHLGVEVAGHLRDRVVRGARAGAVGVGAAAVEEAESAGVDGEDVGERVAVDAEALIVAVGLEDEQGGEVAEDAEAGREVDDLGAEGVADVGVAGREGGAHAGEALDAGADPGALEQRALDGAGGDADVDALVAGEDDAHRDVLGEVGVDEGLVAGLHAAEVVGPDPAGAGDDDLHVGEGGAGELADDVVLGEAGVEDDAVGEELGGGDLAQDLGVLDAAVDDRVDALCAALGEVAGGGLEGAELDVAGGADAVGEDEDAADVGQLADGLEGALEVGGAEGPALEDRGEVLAGEAAGLALVDLEGVLVEGEEAQVEVLAGAAEGGEGVTHAIDLALEAEGPRGAGVEQDGEAGDRCGAGVADDGDAGDGEVVVAQAHHREAALVEDLEVLVGGPLLFAQLDDAAAAGGGGDRGGEAGGGGGGLLEDDAGVEVVELREAAQGQAVGLGGAGELLRVGDDQLLALAREDREDAGAEGVTGLVLEQRGVLLAVQRVLEGDLGGAALDDLALLPLAEDLHGEAGDGRVRGHVDLEAALDGAVGRVLEDEVQLGEGERLLDDGAGLERDELEAGAVAGGE